MKTGLNNLNKEEIEEVNAVLEPNELYCGNCFNFNSDDCPFKYTVDYLSTFEEVGCGEYSS